MKNWKPPKCLVCIHMEPDHGMEFLCHKDDMCVVGKITLRLCKKNNWFEYGVCYASS